MTSLSYRIDHIAEELYFEAKENVLDALSLLSSAQRYKRYSFSSEVWPKIAKAIIEFHKFYSDPAE